MGLFDFFKKKKKQDFLANMPPVMRQAFAVLFPNGEDDFNRQLDDLCSHYGNKYKREDISSNLIFILTGYLITGDSKTKESVIDKVLARKVNTMSKSEVDYLYNYALSNHPKLAMLLTASSMMDALSSDGCDSDTIPGGHGILGYSSENPIPTHGVVGIYEYLDHLRDSAGNKISYTRMGTVDSPISEHPVDVYNVTSLVLQQPITLYISAYHKRNSQLSPSNLILIDSNNVVISSGGTKFGIGQYCSLNETPKPQLATIQYFGVISKDVLATLPMKIQEAEELNRRGFIAFNNGDTETAIRLLKEAVSKGSINAINSLFAVLHSADRNEEAFDTLKNSLRENHVSAALYFNFAVINAGYYAQYPVTPNIPLAKTCLKRAMTLPDDGKEEYQAKIQSRAKEFLDRLETNEL